MFKKAGMDMSPATKALMASTSSIHKRPEGTWSGGEMKEKARKVADFQQRHLEHW
jgi:hypothetical protein